MHLISLIEKDVKEIFGINHNSDISFSNQS